MYRILNEPQPLQDGSATIHFDGIATTFSQEYLYPITQDVMVFKNMVDGRMTVTIGNTSTIVPGGEYAVFFNVETFSVTTVETTSHQFFTVDSRTYKTVVEQVSDNTAAISDATTRIDTVPAYYLNLDNFRKWRAAIGKVKSSTGFAKLLIVGDSTAWGLGAGGADDRAWPKLLASDLNRVYPTQYSFIVPPSTAATGSDNDDRWTAGTGWTKTSWGFGGIAAWQASSGVTAPLTVTPGINCDTLDVWYLKNSGLGSIAISVDGGTATNVSCAGSPIGWAKATVTFAAGSSHAITITPSVNTVFILGCEAYLSTQSSVRLINAGVPNSRAYGGWNDAAGGKSLDGIGAFAPDLTIVMLGVNDARIATTSTPDQWETAIRAIITKAKLSGDVILASVIPSSTSVTGAFALEQEYQTRAKTIAADMGCAFVDVLARYKDWNTANAAGFMFDSLHLNPAGNGDVADAYRTVLTR